MKKTDIAMIILIAVVGVMVAFFGARAILGDQASEPQKVPSIEKITTDIDEPDVRIFNNNAINPSIEVEIDSDTPLSSSDKDNTDTQ